MTIEEVKKLIPFIGAADPKWKKFPKKSFDVHQFRAHRALYDALRSALDSIRLGSFTVAPERNESADIDE